MGKNREINKREGDTETLAQEKGRGRDFSKGHQSYDFDAYPWKDLRDDNWGLHICSFGVDQRYEQWQPDNFRQGGQEHIMQQYKEWEYFSFGVKLWANFPINARKTQNFISHK